MFALGAALISVGVNAPLAGVVTRDPSARPPVHTVVALLDAAIVTLLGRLAGTVQVRRAVRRERSRSR
jgi:hypothetical protein